MLLLLLLLLLMTMMVMVMMLSPRARGAPGGEQLQHGTPGRVSVYSLLQTTC
jgi:hypothetical protein